MHGSGLRISAFFRPSGIRPWEFLGRQPFLVGTYSQADLPILAFSGDLEGAAADFAIRCKTLSRYARIDNEFKLLPTERALDGNRSFHAPLQFSLKWPAVPADLGGGEAGSHQNA